MVVVMPMLVVIAVFVLVVVVVVAAVLVVHMAFFMGLLGAQEVRSSSSLSLR
jgi:hypothetical protein